MAGKAKEKSASRKAADAAKDKLDNASAALEKNKNATTQAAYDAAKKAHSEAVAKANREAFLTIGGGRAELVIVKLDALAKVANPRAYVFTPANIDELFIPIQERLDEVKAQFTAALSGAKSAAPKKAIKLT